MIQIITFTSTIEQQEPQEGGTFAMVGATWRVLEVLPATKGEHKVLAERVKAAPA